MEQSRLFIDRETLKSLMYDEGIPTFKALAKEIGMTTVGLSNAIRGEYPPSRKLVEKLCVLFNCQPGIFLFCDLEDDYDD
jgi:transcriptional regulator with XRE-family HTH domain